MPECQHYAACGLTADADPKAQLCILHSKNPDKDALEFDIALAAYRKRKGDKFCRIAFPKLSTFRNSRFSEPAIFVEAVFFGEADFARTIFAGGADFQKATFFGGADFSSARFSEKTLFSRAVFSEYADFSATSFSDLVMFHRATFSQEVLFSDTKFSEHADFHYAKFLEDAFFLGASFSKQANFRKAIFSEKALFSGTTFSEWVDFSGSMFSGKIDFSNATFFREADFESAQFSKEAEVTFQAVQFRGRMAFTNRYRWLQESPPDEGQKQTIAIFTGAQKIDFRRVVIEPPDALTFIGSDLSRCRFLGTDLRKVQMIGVRWPEKGNRIVVYDEIAPLDEGETRQWEQIEHLYRQLKQNYEDQRDYRRAGDFHYGEKEMQRRNAGTPRGIRVLLRLYWIISGYGERISRPFIWAGALFVLSTFLYLVYGLSPSPKPGNATYTPLALNSLRDWLIAAHYSFRVMVFLKPADLVPLAEVGKLVYTLQSLLGPLFLGLGIFAVRQRLKR